MIAVFPYSWLRFQLVQITLTWHGQRTIQGIRKCSLQREMTVEGPLGLVESPGVTGHVVHENTEIPSTSPGGLTKPGPSRQYSELVLIVEILLDRF